MFFSIGFVLQVSQHRAVSPQARFQHIDGRHSFEQRLCIFVTLGIDLAVGEIQQRVDVIRIDGQRGLKRCFRLLAVRGCECGSDAKVDIRVGCIQLQRSGKLFSRQGVVMLAQRQLSRGRIRRRVIGTPLFDWVVQRVQNLLRVDSAMQIELTERNAAGRIGVSPAAAIHQLVDLVE